MQGLHARRNHRARLDAAARATEHDPVAMRNIPLVRQLRRDFDEHSGLELVQPAVETAHRSTQVVLCQAVAGANQRILGITGRSQLVEWIRMAERRRILSLAIEQVLSIWRLEWLVVRWQRAIFGATGRV